MYAHVSMTTLMHTQPVVVQTAADHNGKERLLVDQLLTETQCQQLITLAAVSSSPVYV